MKKKEKKIFGGILLFALVLWGLIIWLRPHNYESVHIRINGEDYGNYSLLEDQVISIGTTNICEIKNGKLTMIESTCPDHLCMKQGAIDDTGGMIVCLPNKITIEGEGAATSGQDNSGVDAISW